VIILVVIALCASTWRATRLLVKDDLPIVKRPRDWLIRRSERPDGTLRWYGELISCPWCVSVWVAAAFTLATDLVVGLPVPVLVFGLAAAFAATYEDLTTRGICPEIDTRQLVQNALEDPAWQQYAVLRRQQRASVDDPTVHIPQNTGVPR
jgi:hypothetical protein